MSFRRIAVVSLVGFLALPHYAARAGDTPFQRELAASIEVMLRTQESQPRRASVTKPTWLIPVAGIEPDELIDSFGDWRAGDRRHEGIDIFAPRGTPVIAATAGVVTIGRRARGGRCVWITTTGGLEIFYAHLNGWRTGLSRGASVEAGDILGYVGNSGNASGGRCHLHFEIRKHDKPLNPYPVLLKAQSHRLPDEITAAGGR